MKGVACQLVSAKFPLMRTLSRSVRQGQVEETFALAGVLEAIAQDLGAFVKANSHLSWRGPQVIPFPFTDF